MTAHLRGISLLVWKFRGSLLGRTGFFNLGPLKLAQQKQQAFYPLAQRWHKLLLFLWQLMAFFFFSFPKSCLLYDGQQHVEEMCEAETGLLGHRSKHTQWFYCLPWSWPFVSAFCPSVCHASHIEVGIIATRLNEQRPQQFVCNLTWTLGFWKAVFLFFFKHCCLASCA